MKSHLPKISILMPSFNQGAYLETAILSVLKQDYPNKELIVIDGGSTDHSIDILKRHQADLAYWVSERDRGQADALNKGLPKTTGDIIGWLNSDDYYLPGTFTKIANAFETNPEAILVHGERIMIDSKGHVSGWTVLPAFDPASSGYVICSETAFWRRNRTEALCFNEKLRFAMDVDFFCRLYRQGPFLKLNSYLGAFRCHAASKSSTLVDVAHSEGQPLWREIFPEHPEGWRNQPRVSKIKIWLSFLGHPFLIALPYLYRRFFLGPRDMETRD